MGRYLTKTVFLVLTPILLLHLFISPSSGEFRRVHHVTQMRRREYSFPYESQGKPPKSACRELEDLNTCTIFSGKTCCSASQMKSASLAVKNLATYGEATEHCLDLFELLECTICYSRVGIRSGPPRICASFCDQVFEACSDAYFSSNASTQIIVPCGASEDTICRKASKWASNGTAFCNATGFTVQTGEEEEPCFGSSAMKESLPECMFEMISLQVLVLAGLFFLNSLDKWLEERRARIRREARERLEQEEYIGQEFFQR